VAGSTTLAPYPTDIYLSKDHLAVLIERYSKLASSARAAADAACGARNRQTAIAKLCYNHSSCRCARAAKPRSGYTNVRTMIRLPALLLAGCVVSTTLILLGRGFISSDSALFERSPRATEIKTGVQAREIAEPGPTQRPPEAPSSDNTGDLRPSDVRLSGIVIEPDQRIAIFAVNGAKSVILSEGEKLNDWRVSISPQQVSLSGPSGTMTLKPKPDANLVRPAAPSASPAGPPQPDGPPRFLHRNFPWFPAPAGAPEQPTAATLIAAVPAPVAAQTQDYSYTDCNNPYYAQYCQEYYAPYDYSFPYYAYGVPAGFGFFHHHDLHQGGFHRGFHGVPRVGFVPGGRFHGGFRGGGFHAGGAGHGGHR
jgi:hypothetical protein